MLRAYVFFGVVVLARAQIPSIGFCPDYLPMSDFDIDSFLGKWYEAERYFQFSDIVSRCVVTDYAKGPNGKIYMSNEVTNRLTAIKRVIDGTLELSGRVGEGKLNVKYATTPLSSQATLTVLDTDYDNYAVIWSCSGFGLLYAQSAWVMTRERLPPGPVLQKIYGVLDKFKISRSFFVKTDQEGCALAASDINAANGITGQSTLLESDAQPPRKLPILGNLGNVEKSVETSNSVKSENNIKPETVEAVKSVDGIIPARVTEVLPEGTNADPINSETVNSAVVNTLVVGAAADISEAVKSAVTQNEGIKSVPTTENELPIEADKIIPEINDKQIEPQLISEIKPEEAVQPVPLTP